MSTNDGKVVYDSTSDKYKLNFADGKYVVDLTNKPVTSISLELVDGTNNTKVYANTDLKPDGKFTLAETKTPINFKGDLGQQWKVLSGSVESGFYKKHVVHFYSAHQGYGSHKGNNGTHYGRTTVKAINRNGVVKYEKTTTWWTYLGGDARDCYRDTDELNMDFDEDVKIQYSWNLDLGGYIAHSYGGKNWVSAVGTVKVTLQGFKHALEGYPAIFQPGDSRPWYLVSKKNPYNFNKIRFTSYHVGGGYYRECHGTHRVDFYNFKDEKFMVLNKWYWSNENTGRQLVVFPTTCTNFEVALPGPISEIKKMHFSFKIEAKSSLRHGLKVDLFDPDTGSWRRILDVQDYRTWNSQWGEYDYNINLKDPNS